MQLTTNAEDNEKVADVQDYLITHGALLKFAGCRPMGVSLTPTPFPKDLFQKAISLQSLYNTLYLRAANDWNFLKKLLQPMTNRGNGLLDCLIAVAFRVAESNRAQLWNCAIFRSDYMVEKGALKQVEFNTFSVAGACHAENIYNMHQHFEERRRVVEVSEVCRSSLQVHWPSLLAVLNSPA